MQIAFYAPLKSPNHPMPSGDRQVARLVVRALGEAGHRVTLASELRGFLAEPTADAVARLKAQAAAEAERIAAAWRRDGRPDLWFCYHPYYKAPDWIGPVLADRFGVPLVTLEASYSRRRDTGEHASLQADVVALIGRAAANLCFTRRDRDGLAAVAPAERLHLLRPFIDTAPFRDLAPPARPANGPVRLVTVAMMRPGDKLASYRFLAAALGRLAGRDFTLDVVGDGPCGAEVRALFAPLGVDRVRFHGEVAPEAVPALLAAADLYLWPGIGEAFGLAYLEAAAAGLPAVAQRTAGVPEVVADGETGLLTPEGDVAAFTEAVAALMADRPRRRSLGAAARARVLRDHSVEAAAARLDTVLTAALGAGARA
jgi:glycosyltransferase involved in cell wall biosynthesis